jgi:hypothetical protein
MSDGIIKILDGNTFVVSDDRGDIEASLTDPRAALFDTASYGVLTVDANGCALSVATSSTSRRGSSWSRAPAPCTSTPSCP